MRAGRYFTAPVSFLEHDGKVLALNQTCRSWAVLNETAAAIVQACRPDGTTVDEILSEFRRRFGRASADELEAWLGALEERGLLARVPLRDQPKPTLAPYSVVHVYIELLARCNLRCIHCFMGGAPERTESLTAREVLSLIADLNAAGGRYVTLSGGEPLLHPAFDDIARFVADLGLMGTVISNGTAIRPRSLDLIAALGFNLAISLDGISDPINQQIRGISAKRVIRVIDRVIERLGPDRFTLSFTPVKANLDEIEPLFDFVVDRGIRRVNISVYEEVGRAPDHAADLTLSPAERVRLMVVLFRKAVDLIGKTEIDLNDTRNILSQFIPTRGEDEVHPLWRSVRISSSGDVFPGSFGAVERFRLGNIRETPLADLLHSDTLEALYRALCERVAKTPECSHCSWRQICGGGSVAAAFSATGKIYAPDPHCEGYKTIFPEVAVSLVNRFPEMA
jgi:radical SAM protein with 4Fe4S-binding SPASM domain